MRRLFRCSAPHTYEPRCSRRLLCYLAVIIGVAVTEANGGASHPAEPPELVAEAQRIVAAQSIGIDRKAVNPPAIERIQCDFVGTPFSIGEVRVGRQAASYYDAMHGCVGNGVVTLEKPRKWRVVIHDFQSRFRVGQNSRRGAVIVQNELHRVMFARQKSADPGTHFRGELERLRFELQIRLRDGAAGSLSLFNRSSSGLCLLPERSPEQECGDCCQNQLPTVDPILGVGGIRHPPLLAQILLTAIGFAFAYGSACISELWPRRPLLALCGVGVGLLCCLSLFSWAAFGSPAEAFKVIVPSSY